MTCFRPAVDWQAFLPTANPSESYPPARLSVAKLYRHKLPQGAIVRTREARRKQPAATSPEGDGLASEGRNVGLFRVQAPLGSIVSSSESSSFISDERGGDGRESLI